MPPLKPKKLTQEKNTGANELADVMVSLSSPGVDTERIAIKQLVPANKEWNFYRPLGKDKLEELAASIRHNGLLHPIVVWAQNDGNYMILSGHNRVEAYRMLFEQTQDFTYKQILSQVKQEITEDEAKEIIIDSNWVQRTLSASERTKSIYEKYVLLGRKKRSSIETEKGRTYDLVAREYQLSGKQIQRYIKLNQLIQPLLDQIDEGRISLRAGLALAGLDIQKQQFVYTHLTQHISNKTLERLHKDMTEDSIFCVLQGEKENSEVEVTLSVPIHLADAFRAMAEDWIMRKKEI